MLLKLDGTEVAARPDETLLTLIERAGLNIGALRDRPLAAQIGGEIFSLHYAPVRMREGKETMRRHVALCGGDVKLLRIGDAQGWRLYRRTLQLILICAVRRLFPGARAQVQHTLSNGLFITLEKSPALTEKDVRAIYEECGKIVAADLPLKRERIKRQEALDYFADDGQLDKVRLFQWRAFEYFDVYRIGDYMDCFYGEMAPSTGYVAEFGLEYLWGGMILLMPDRDEPEHAVRYVKRPKLAAVFRESEEWARLLSCANVADLNGFVADGRVRELIRVNEALHEKRYASLADEIVRRGARAVLVAGPSSSGKTTSANRLYTQLRVLGKKPVMLSLDDYYFDRADIPPDENGNIDFESIDTLDIARFNDDLALLIAGEAVETPLFDFAAGKRKPVGRTIQLGRDDPLIIEGLHGLNERMLGPAVPRALVFRLYVSAWTTLNLDDHNHISTSDVRLLRRLIRDYFTRGASLEETFSLWDNVKRGETTWIYPYQEQADAFLNTTLVYELAVLKRHVYPLLAAVEPQSPHYADAVQILSFLDYFVATDAETEAEIPPTSVLREFIGGNAFYR